MRVMGKGLLPAAERLVDRVNGLVRAGIENLRETDTSPSYPRTQEEALFLVRDRLGKLIVERRRIQRHIAGLPDTASDLTGKAELAIRHGREDLARAALGEASRLGEDGLALETDLTGLNADIALLEQAVAHLTGGASASDIPTRALLLELDRLARNADKPGSKA